MKESWLRRAFRWVAAGRWDRSSPSAQPHRETDDLHEWVRSLTSAQLCRLWRVSFLTILSAKSEAELEELAQKRRLYLEELEIRNPAGFEAWIGTSPAASSDPEPYLTQRSDSERRRFGSF